MEHRTEIKLDFNPLDILVVCGDIHVGNLAKEFLEEACYNYAHVVYVLGNHEFYHNEINAIRRWWERIDMPDNFHFLDNDVVEIEDYRFIGSTLWTDLSNPLDAHVAKTQMADYMYIRESDNLFTPAASTELHRLSKRFIEYTLQHEFDGYTFVVTHHMPSKKLINPRWEGNALNCAFANNLDRLFEEYDITAWFFGHTHDKVCQKINKTWCICNPRGYPNELYPANEYYKPFVLKRDYIVGKKDEIEF